MQWYAVHTHARDEMKAMRHLGRQGFEVYLPQLLKRRRHARRTDWVPSPLFPRYLFVRMDPEGMRWRAINSTSGVSYLVCNGDRPTFVPSGIIEEILDRTGDDGMVHINPGPFKKGAPVRITDGAFCDHVGLFECADDQMRVFILLDLMGRQVKVRVAAEAVCAPA